MVPMNKVVVFQVNEMSDNATINWGNSLQKGFTAPQHHIGGQNMSGNCSFGVTYQHNRLGTPGWK